MNLVIADDHSLVRDGLKSLLEIDPEIKIIAECTDGTEVIELATAGSKIDVVLSDLSMPGINGIEMVKILKVQNPDIRVIILTMMDDIKYARKAFDAGASAYVLKNVDLSELLLAFDSVKEGRKYLCSELMERMLSDVDTLELSGAALTNEDAFSSREIEVLNLIAEGYTNFEISEKLFLSKRTVEGHRQSLLTKTNSRNTACLIRYAVTQRLLN